MTKRDMALEAYDTPQPELSVGDRRQDCSGDPFEVLDIMLSLYDGGLFYYVDYYEGIGQKTIDRAMAEG